MVAADDVAAILPRVAECGGTYHLTDGHHPTFAEVESAMARSLGVRVPPRIPLPVARAGARVLLALKYVGDLGNTPGHVNHWSKGGFAGFVDTELRVTSVSSPIPWTMVTARTR